MEKYNKIRDDAFQMTHNVLMEKFGDDDLFSWEYLTERIEIFGSKNSDILIHFN